MSSSWMWGRVRLIALTGYGLPSDRQATADAGFDHHLVKPVQAAELFKAIADAAASNALRESCAWSLSPRVPTELTERRIFARHRVASEF